MSTEQEREARRRWAYGYIKRAAEPPPKYGSPEWQAMPEGPEKVAACVIAAESWAVDCELNADLHDILMDQLWHQNQHLDKQREDAEWVARGEAHKAAWNPDRPGFRMTQADRDAIEAEWRQWMGGAA